MAKLIDYAPDRHEADLRALWTTYLEEGATPVKEELGIEMDIPTIVENDLRHLVQFSPPAGRLLLAVEGDAVLGCGCLRRLAPEIAEVKRMYLRPEARGRGIGRQLLAGLLDAARQAGYREARLDSGQFMTDAHSLYRAAGFIPCDPYPESEIPAEFHDRWLFMRRDLANAATDADARGGAI
jgi:ribosomal protein S18 acetylase RimI-like enzyme